MRNTFRKSERITRQLVIDKLFAGGNVSMAAFPLRVVYMRQSRPTSGGAHALPEVSIQMDGSPRAPRSLHPASRGGSLVEVLISVPKRRFRHAVDRNRMKRLVREAYRLNKSVLWDALEDKDFGVALAFVCITDTLPTFRTVNKSVRKLLVRISEQVAAGQQQS